MARVSRTSPELKRAGLGVGGAVAEAWAPKLAFEPGRSGEPKYLNWGDKRERKHSCGHIKRGKGNVCEMEVHLSGGQTRPSDVPGVESVRGFKYSD